jgi:hypothetical protein
MPFTSLTSCSVVMGRVSGWSSSDVSPSEGSSSGVWSFRIPVNARSLREDERTQSTLESTQGPHGVFSPHRTLRLRHRTHAFNTLERFVLEFSTHLIVLFRWEPQSIVGECSGRSQREGRT